MRIRELFTIPEGEKVTEKMFGRVLLSTVCGILLCMACLTGTTWAWFAVDIENKGNVIQIGTADVTVTVDGDALPLEPGTYLPQGSCTLRLENSNLPDDFDTKAALYVTLYFDGEAAGYVVLDDGNERRITVGSGVGKNVAFSWVASWFPPSGVDPLPGDTVFLDDAAGGA